MKTWIRPGRSPRSRPDAATSSRLPAMGSAAALLLALCVAPEAATLYGLVDTGEIFVSTGGALWNRHSTLVVRDAVAMQARVSSSDLYLATRSGAVYHSIDGGHEWTPTGPGVEAGDVVDLHIQPDADILLLTRSGSVYGSEDSGRTFVSRARITHSDDLASLERLSTGSLYALARSGGVYRMDEQGSEPEPRGAVGIGNAVRMLGQGSTLLVLSETGALYRSTDGGAAWEPVGPLPPVSEWRGLAGVGSTLYAATREGHVYRSLDSVNWSTWGTINQLSLTAIENDEPAVSGAEGQWGGGVVALGPPVPNPAVGGRGVFSIGLGREAAIGLDLIDARGRVVARSALERYAPGIHLIDWDTGVRTAGIYFVRLRGANATTPGWRWTVLR